MGRVGEIAAAERELVRLARARQEQRRLSERLAGQEVARQEAAKIQGSGGVAALHRQVLRAEAREQMKLRERWGGVKSKGGKAYRRRQAELAREREGA